MSSLFFSDSRSFFSRYLLIGRAEGIASNKRQLSPSSPQRFLSEKARPAELRLGCKNGWKIWLNGKLIFGRDEYHRGAEKLLKSGPFRYFLFPCFEPAVLYFIFSINFAYTCNIRSRRKYHCFTPIVKLPHRMLLHPHNSYLSGGRLFPGTALENLPKRHAG